MRRWRVTIYGREAELDAPTRAKARYAAYRAYRDGVSSCLSFRDFIRAHSVAPLPTPDSEPRP